MRRISERLLIVADDLTGALDTAAPFAARGYMVLVVTDVAALQGALATGADVVAITTRSREVAPELAAARVAAASALLPDGMRLVKKVDSRLKGHIVAELGALDFQRALVVPAIPEFGRVVRNGMITGFGVDEPISVSEKLGPFADRSIIPDTENVAALEAAIDARSPDDLLVGARSMAEALARDSVIVPHPAKLPSDARILMAIGSRDPITVAQTQALSKAFPQAHFIAAPNGIAPAGGDEQNSWLTVIQAVPGISGVSGEEVATSLAKACATFQSRVDVMLLSGGATAEAFFEREQIQVLKIIGEVLPGLPVAEYQGRYYITKSGGFGDAETLVRVAHAALSQGQAE